MRRRLSQYVRLSGRGVIARGAWADLVLVNGSGERWLTTETSLHNIYARAADRKGLFQVDPRQDSSAVYERFCGSIATRRPSTVLRPYVNDIIPGVAVGTQRSSSLRTAYRHQTCKNIGLTPYIDVFVDGSRF